jgi:hypothetical protein
LLVDQELIETCVPRRLHELGGGFGKFLLFVKQHLEYQATFSMDLGNAKWEREAPFASARAILATAREILLDMRSGYGNFG